MQVVVRLDPGDRPERRLAALPQQRPLGVVGGDPDVPTPCVGELRMRSTSASTPPGSPTTSTSSAARCSTGSPAWMYASTACEAELIHHLDRGRDDAGGDDVADGRAPSATVESPSASSPRRRVLRERRRPRWRRRTSPRCRRTTPRRSSRRARDPRRRAPSPSRRAARPRREDVRAGHPVGEAVRAAGVVRDVAADRTRLLAARIGREVHAEVGEPASTGRG